MGERRTGSCDWNIDTFLEYRYVCKARVGVILKPPMRYDRSGYVAVLGSRTAWADGKMNPVEIAADPEASALTETFKGQIAEQLGALSSSRRKIRVFRWGRVLLLSIKIWNAVLTNAGVEHGSIDVLNLHAPGVSLRLMAGDHSAKQQLGIEYVRRFH